MSALLAAFWAESLKTRRSRLALGLTVAFLILPLFDGLFMVILKDPEQARAMGLISMKAQLAGGVADWVTYFSILLQGTAVGGVMLFSFITAWVFGREFSDHTVKELLAIPAPRWSIVAAKFVWTALWIAGLTLLSLVVALALGALLALPGWSMELAAASAWSLVLTALLLLLLMPLVAFFASAGRGYLPALGWALLTLFMAQILGLLGWGDWFPWTVPALAAGMMGPRSDVMGLHSYLAVLLVFVAGLVATFIWWRSADQAK